MTCSGPLNSIHNCWGCNQRRSTARRNCCFFDLEGVRLLLERGVPSSVLYLEVEDVRLSISVLQGRGVEVIALPHVTFHHGDAALGPAGTDEWMAFIATRNGTQLIFSGWLLDRMDGRLLLPEAGHALPDVHSCRGEPAGDRFHKCRMTSGMSAPEYRCPVSSNLN